VGTGESQLPFPRTRTLTSEMCRGALNVFLTFYGPVRQNILGSDLHALKGVGDCREEKAPCIS
jgi:hypothetical protein